MTSETIIGYSRQNAPQVSLPATKRPESPLLERWSDPDVKLYILFYNNKRIFI